MNWDEIRDYQLAQLELIKMMDKLCAELGLTYYIIAGTLLGAVRHDGFIPWDPDIDIAMPRKDYEKIREYFANNKSERYFYDHYSTEKYHIQPHALVRIKGSHVVFKSSKPRYMPTYDGIYLDIFPLDNAPKEKKLQEKQMKKIKRLKKIVYIKNARVYKNNNLLMKLSKRFVSLLLTPFSFEYLNKKMDKVMQKYNDPSAETLVSMASHYSYWKQLMPKSVYGTPKRIKFEGIELSAPAETIDYLTRLYGDYMKLPPEEHRNAMLNIFERVEYSAEEK
ncbi:MAG: LicD family protein [Clostridia bacterium]|nr:LicD family protein [Clostridia bacterium]